MIKLNQPSYVQSVTERVKAEFVSALCVCSICTCGGMCFWAESCDLCCFDSRQISGFLLTINQMCIKYAAMISVCLLFLDPFYKYQIIETLHWDKAWLRNRPCTHTHTHRPHAEIIALRRQIKISIQTWMYCTHSRIQSKTSTHTQACTAGGDLPTMFVFKWNVKHEQDTWYDLSHF